MNRHYAEVTDDTVTTVAVCDDPAHAEEMGWVLIEDLDPMPWIGWTRDGEAWKAPPADDEPT